MKDSQELWGQQLKNNLCSPDHNRVIYLNYIRVGYSKTYKRLIDSQPYGYKTPTIFEKNKSLGGCNNVEKTDSVILVLS